MKNLLVFIAFACAVHLAIMANATKVNFLVAPADTAFNDQDTTKTKRQANPKNKRNDTREKTGMPPDVRTDTATVPPTPFDTSTNPSGLKK